MRNFPSVALLVWVFLISAAPAATATDWFVSPAGAVANAGSMASPWNFASAMTGHSGSIQPGDTIYLMDGVYYVDRSLSMACQPVKLIGTSDQPITIRPAPGARVRIDGGLAVGGWDPNHPWLHFATGYLTIRDLEIFNSDWIQPVVSHQTGSWPSDVPSALGGLRTYNGEGNKYINLVIHDVEQGMSIWEHDANMEAYGNIVYNCGWTAPDRSHGHCVYTQNRYGVKTYTENLYHTLNPDGQSSMNVYSSGDTGYTNNFLVQRNVAYGGGKLLVGGGRPSEGMRVLGNLLYKTPLWNGYYFSIRNIQYEVRDNLVFGENMHFFNIQNLVESNNVVVEGQKIYYQTQTVRTTLPGIPRPAQPWVYVAPNAHEAGRANVVIFNWQRAGSVQVDFQGVIGPNQPFRLMDPKAFYGTPVFQGMTDASGRASVPTPAEFHVWVALSDAAGSNFAPLVDAGADRSIRLPVNTAALDGTVSDDGQPTGAAVTQTWSKLSGPGTVTFANASATDTTATFSDAGAYVLRLTASDTDRTGWDDVTIIVQPSGPNLLLYLPFDEGSGATSQDLSGNGRNATLLNGVGWTAGKFGSAAIFDEVDDVATVADFPLPEEFSVAFWFKPTDNLGTFYQYMFSWGTALTKNSVQAWLVESGVSPSTNFLRTDVEDSNDAMLPGNVDINDPATYLNGDWHHYCLTVSSTGGIKVYVDAVLKASDPNQGGDPIDPGTALHIGGRSDLSADRYFGGAIDEVRVYGSTLSAADVVTVMNGAPNNVAPTVNGGADQTVTMPDAAHLEGVVSDDALPTPLAACTYAWSMVSGPGTVLFGSPNTASTTADFATAGTYILRLTASDSVLSANDELTVTVKAQLRADFNGDGKVDGLDFLVWQSEFGL